MKRVGYWTVIAVPPALYFVSLLAPAAGPVLKGGSGFEGHEAYRYAYRGAFELDDWFPERIELILGWLANPAMWIAFGCVMIGLRRVALVVAGLACGLCMAVLPSWGKLVVEYPAFWLWGEVRRAL